MFRVFVIISIAILAGCTSNQYLSKSTDSSQMSPVREKMFVTNPEIGRPYEILKSSNIYELVSEAETSNRLTLKSAYGRYRCGNPLVGSFITLGLIPVSLPETRDFSYVIESEEGTKGFYHSIPVYSRFSVWEWLFKPFAKSEDNLLAQGLKQAAREPLDMNDLRLLGR